MGDHVDLELTIQRGAAGGYELSMRLSQPGSDADTRLGPAHDLPVFFDLPALQTASIDPAAYGKFLTASLFTGGALEGFREARAAAQATGAALRLRLLIAPDAAELHRLYWETLRDPEDPASPLFTGETVLFSRYIPSRDLSPVSQRPRGQLKALAAAANPSDLGEYGLMPVDVEAELERARRGLGDIPVTPLAGLCTLEALTGSLRDGYDILYLVAHGTFHKGGPWLLLEKPDGALERAAGGELVRRLREMQVKPRLIVLASCESAGKGTGEALQALGPELAAAGVPAVLAMQGSISTGTVAGFMPVFFHELQKDGSIDRAVSTARGAVRSEPDFWMPALFMRLKSGRLWSEAKKETPVTVIRGGDTYNVSNIHNSNLNLGSTVISVPKPAGGTTSTGEAGGGELEALLAQLEAALGEASGAEAEAAGAAAALTRELAENLTKKKPARARIRVILDGLEGAAQTLAGSLPEAPALVSRLKEQVTRSLML